MTMITDMNKIERMTFLTSESLMASSVARVWQAAAFLAVDPWGPKDSEFIHGWQTAVDAAVVQWEYALSHVPNGIINVLERRALLMEALSAFDTLVLKEVR